MQWLVVSQNFCGIFQFSSSNCSYIDDKWTIWSMYGVWCHYVQFSTFLSFSKFCFYSIRYFWSYFSTLCANFQPEFSTLHPGPKTILGHCLDLTLQLGSPKWTQIARIPSSLYSTCKIAHKTCATPLIFVFYVWWPFVTWSWPWLNRA